MSGFFDFAYGLCCVCLGFKCNKRIVFTSLSFLHMLSLTHTSFLVTVIADYRLESIFKNLYMCNVKDDVQNH